MEERQVSSTGPEGEPDKRARILAAAAKVFSEQGYHPARVEEIARQADVGKGTIYEYFDTKEILFQEMMQEGLQTYTDEFRRRLGAGGSLRDILASLISARLAFIREHRNMAKIALSNPEIISERIRNLFLTVRGDVHWELARRLAAGIRTGEMRAVDMDVAAGMFLGALDAICLPVVLSGSRMTAVVAEASILDIFLGGVAGDGDGEAE